MKIIDNGKFLPDKASTKLSENITEDTFFPWRAPYVVAFYRQMDFCHIGNTTVIQMAREPVNFV